MCGIYRRSIYKKAKECLENDMHQLMNLLKNSEVDYAEFNSSEEFYNLNSPAEYEIAMTKF
jgi:molybdopterin-guanine dinucleotide biosynthesis protein A